MSTTLELGATTTPKSEEESSKSVDLDLLRKEIDDLAESIRALKSSSSPDEDVSGDVVSAKVKELLDKRRLFAENNGGIGTDGKKFEEPLSKAEKKRRAKEEKAKKAASAAGGAAGAGGEGGEMSENAKKKAAKKAEKAAKKAAMKAGGGADAAGAAAKTTPAAPRTKGGAPASVAPTPSSASATTTATLDPMEMSFNPNHPVHRRPLVALTAAVLCNVAPDLTLISDHRRYNPALGIGSDGGAAVVVGDLAMARHILRSASSASSSSSSSGGYYGETASSLAGGGSPEVIDQWLDYASSMMQHRDAAGEEGDVDVDSNKLRALVVTVNRHLTDSNTTYLAGDGGRTLTLADVAIYAALGWPAPQPPHLSSVGKATLDLLTTHSSSSLKAISRWIKVMSSHPSIREATQLAIGITNNAEVTFSSDNSDVLPPLHEGMNTLEGATPGNVVTRFPPEPSGYLHIGHAKAVLLNDYYATRYRGRLIVRFDDTNPSKEKSEFEESIVEDLARLGVSNIHVVTYTSDYLDTIRGYAEMLIRDGSAYMDDTDQETMQAERLAKQNSKHRAQNPDEAMELFEQMCSGSEEGSKWCLRARIDMSSLNGTMRDPVIYRQNLTPHHRTGTTHKAYPTYDLACPIVDSIEGVTHALRTTEYNDRDEQYGWIQRSLGLRRVRIHSFARMNFMYTELSKRKLTWFVENGIVDGWDDPRMPTVRGVSRRGVSVDALRDFILMQGASRRVTLMDWAKFWAENRKVIDTRAGRYMAIAADTDMHVKLTVLNGPDVDSNEYVTTDLHPKDPSLGRRVVRIGKEVLLEKVDVEGMVVGENIVLMRWGVVNITKVGAGEDGIIEGNLVPDGDFKAAKRKLSWIADAPERNTRMILSEFDNLISKEKLEDGEDFKDFVNPNTRATSEVIGDALLKTLGRNDVIQLERRGYFRVDRPYVSESKPLMLFMIPDGKAKPMSGLAGQLAHR